MFEIVTRLVILVLLTYLIWYVLVKLLPQVKFKWFLPILLLVLIILGILFPNDESVATIWQIISFPLKPTGLLLLLLIIGSAQVQEKKIPTSLKSLVWSLLIIALFSSIPWISQRLEYSIIRSNLNHAEICPDNPNYSPLPKQSKLIVMLANSVTEPGRASRPSEQVFTMSDRLLQTVREYQNNRPEIVLIASRKKPASETERIPSEFELIRDQLVTLGIPSQDIFNLNQIFDNTLNVKQTSEAINAYIQARGLSNYQVIIISSPLDVGRVKLTLEKTLRVKLGRRSETITVIPSAWNLANKFCPKQQLYPDIFDLIPSDASVLRSGQVVDEFLTSSYYFLRNWLTPCSDCWDAVSHISRPMSINQLSN